MKESMTYGPSWVPDGRVMIHSGSERQDGGSGFPTLIIWITDASWCDRSTGRVNGA
jgi:hypothetical protein